MYVISDLLMAGKIIVKECQMNVVCCGVLQCEVVCDSVCCGVLQCVAVDLLEAGNIIAKECKMNTACCSVLQCVVVCDSVSCGVLRCVAVCCNVLQWTSWRRERFLRRNAR